VRHGDLVHTNSSINNKAAFLMIKGGTTTVNGIPYVATFPPLGAGKAAILYYRLLLHRRVPSTLQLVDLVNAAIVATERGISDGSAAPYEEPVGPRHSGRA
jgi:Zn-dependent metalloprotease